MAKWHPGARSPGTVMTHAAGDTTTEDTEDAAPSCPASRPDRGWLLPGPRILPEGPLPLSSRQGGRVLPLPLSRLGPQGLAREQSQGGQGPTGPSPRLKEARLVRRQCAGGRGRPSWPGAVSTQGAGEEWPVGPLVLGSEPRAVQSARFVSLSPFACLEDGTASRAGPPCSRTA